ncbi:unnamed protein product [Miscanthus lutarioriparius]|uniref:Glucose-6-phosphate 1-epimerase n=1 Tax=Miscanthus lutarioriparius TaxID=422564 RepID=A0A811NG15_9POAL|nr:unnamed protein product [Miscanthus lutarioriparius]
MEVPGLMKAWVYDVYGDAGVLKLDEAAAEDQVLVKVLAAAIDLHGPLTTFSSHSLKHVFALSEVRVEGLETLNYLDNLQSKNRCTEQGDAVVFESEVDKVYLSAPPKIVIIDHEKKRTFVLRKEGLPDVVVWNPWDKKAKAMPDFGDEEYKSMLCVGAAAIEKPITLKPGEEWIGKQEISAVLSSYSSGQLDPELIRRMHTI